MAIAPLELQILWSTVSSFALATGNTWEQLSDEAVFAEAIGFAEIQLKANQTTGTPASGDYVDFYASVTLGDPDGSGANEYPAIETPLGRLDVNANNPSGITVNCPVGKAVKIRAVGAGFLGADVCTVSATILQHTA